MDWTKVYHYDILSSFNYQKMTLEQKGLYCHILFLQAATKDGILEFDEQTLARNCNVSLRQFKRVFGSIKYKFVFENAPNCEITTETPELNKIYFYNERMKNIVEAREHISKINSKNGHKGGIAEKGTGKRTLKRNKGERLSYKIREDKIREDNILFLQNEEEKNTAFSFEQCADMWNDFAAENGLERIIKLSDSRKAQFQKRQKSFAEAKVSPYTKEFWELVLQGVKIRRNGFYVGNNKTNWKITFDWLLEKDERIDAFVNAVPSEQDSGGTWERI